MISSIKFSLLLVSVCTTSAGLALSLSAEIEEFKAQALLQAYPTAIAGISVDRNELIWRGASRPIVFDLHRGVQSFENLMMNADLQDVFYFHYPLKCRADWRPAKNYDPGRIRSDELMNHLYGESQSEIEKNLETVSWLNGESITVSKKSGVSESLRRLKRIFLQPSFKSFQKFLTKVGGGYNRRFIAGTKKLSSHSWGQAIDINVEHSNYWKWELDSHGKYQYKNSVPCEIVNAFQSEGWIWGGKWNHYDTMHFEYRPEVLVFSKKLTDQYGSNLNGLTNSSAELSIQF